MRNKYIHLRDYSYIFTKIQLRFYQNTPKKKQKQKKNKQNNK